MKRRKFIQSSALGSLALGMSLNGCTTGKDNTIPKRPLGKTGEKLSIIGFGGIMLKNNPQDFANELVAMAFDAGVNYYDISPFYGNAEERLGHALKPYRDKCFLACKTEKRDAVNAEKALHESLALLQTDHFDLYQLHMLSSVEEVEQAFGPGGAMEVFHKAKKQGKVRYLGFSAHSVDAAMLAMQKFDFDTILFPINFNCWLNGNFGPQVFETAKSKGMGILAIKAMALTLLKEDEVWPYKNVWYLPIEDDAMAKLAFRYTLSKEITAAIPPGDVKFFYKALEVITDLKTITTAETNLLTQFVAEKPPIFSYGAV
jgi:predicted aldo/keto reductase-like oxidoreductase